MPQKGAVLIFPPRIWYSMEPGHQFVIYFRFIYYFLCLHRYLHFSTFSYLKVVYIILYAYVSSKLQKYNVCLLKATGWGETPCELGKLLWGSLDVPLVSLTSPLAKQFDEGIWDECLSSSRGCSYSETVNAICCEFMCRKSRILSSFLLNRALVRYTLSLVTTREPSWAPLFAKYGISAETGQIGVSVAPR